MKAQTIGFVVALLISLSSCQELKVRLAILEANIHYQRSEYAEAIAAYATAAQAAAESPLDSSVRTKLAAIGPYAEYGLALSYAALGETEAALERYQLIAENAEVALRAAALYNAGLLEYERHDYTAAAKAFRQVLEILFEQPFDRTLLMAARRNLELTLGQLTQAENRLAAEADLELAKRLMSVANTALPASGQADQSANSGMTKQSLHQAVEAVPLTTPNQLSSQWLFDFIEREEVNRWASLEWQGNDHSQLDY